MSPPAPGRLSTTTCWRQLSVSFCPRTRARKSLAAPGGKEKPFFINVAFNAVHSVVKARPDLAKKYEGTKSDGTRRTKPAFAALTEGEDQAIARILHYLDESGLSENTLVFFTSDNGGSGAGPRNAPLRAAKGSFYEGGLRVPLIARWPGVVKPGRIGPPEPANHRPDS